MPTQQLDRLATLILNMGKHIREETAGKGLSPFTALRIEALRYIASEHGPTMRELANHFSITPPSATTLVQGLVKEGALERVPDTTDRRITRLKLTPQGKRALTAGSKELTRHMKQVFTKLTPQEQTTLVAIFEKLTARYHHD